jgi:Heterokaryon incompatibility protein (HET)
VSASSYFAFEPTAATPAQSLIWVKLQLHKCLRSHTLCPKQVESRLPRRILHLAENGSDSLHVTLQETNGATGKYACLIHRPGSVKTCKATQSNYIDLLSGIPWSSIPATFQDAMMFCYTLGINYIWIDSLCIVDDDDANSYKHQTLQIPTIYNNSYITLAASAALNDDSGCFWDLFGPGVSEFKTDLGSFSVRKAVTHSQSKWESISRDMSPTLSKAALPSPRLIHFSQNELVWECKEVGTCQCGH